MRVAIAAELGQRQCDVEDARAGQHGVGRAAARQGSDAWNRREAGGGAGVAATASGCEVRLRQTAGDVARQGEASARPGSGGAEAGVTRGRAQSGTGAAGVAHMARAAAAARGRGKQRRGGGAHVDEGGPSCKMQKYRDSTVIPR
jgi:hypothetical protein